MLRCWFLQLSSCDRRFLPLSHPSEAHKPPETVPLHILKFQYNPLNSTLLILSFGSSHNVVKVFESYQNAVYNPVLSDVRRRRARIAKRFKYCLLVDKSNGTFVVQAVLCKKASKWSVDVDGGWFLMKVNVIHNGMRAAPHCLCVHLRQRRL